MELNSVLCLSERTSLNLSGCPELAELFFPNTWKKADSKYHLHRYSHALKINGLEDKTVGPNLDEIKPGFIEFVLSFRFLSKYVK